MKDSVVVVHELGGLGDVEGRLSSGTHHVVGLRIRGSKGDARDRVGSDGAVGEGAGEGEGEVEEETESRPRKKSKVDGGD